MLSGKGSGLLGISGLPSVISDRETPSRRLGVGGSRGVEKSLDLGLTKGLGGAKDTTEAERRQSRPCPRLQARRCRKQTTGKGRVN